MSLTIIISIIICIIIATAYITTLICNHEFSSLWQIITYSDSSVEPKEIYICKRCNNKEDLNRHYCGNCGSLMKNGISHHYYSDKIKLSEWEGCENE